MDINDIILRFFRDDVGGILITDTQGEIIYQDERAAAIRQAAKMWDVACPPPREDQKAEPWDLPVANSRNSYMVVSSTLTAEGQTLQVHHIIENSVYMALYRDINDYSRILKNEKEHDGLTGLFNKGKFMAMKQSVFQDQDSIAIFNMDVNNLKHMNDTYGHEAGDHLIKKAADSLHRIEARDVMAFRMGGDEFLVVALHMTRDEADRLLRDWENGLAELNRLDDGVTCVMACGVVYGERGYDLEELLVLADQRMYEDKKAKKQQRS